MFKDLRKKFLENPYNGSNKVETGFALFTAQSYKEARAIVGEWKEGGEIVDELEKLRYNDEFIAVYDAEIVQKKLENSARKEGYTEGESVGIKKEKHSIASSMLKKNFDIKNRVSKIMRQKAELVGEIGSSCGILSPILGQKTGSHRKKCGPCPPSCQKTRCIFV